MDELVSEKTAIRIILFQLSGETWGIDFKDIQEVLELGKITPVPKTPSFILGIINQRGRIITVIDFSLFIGEREDDDRDARIVHIRSDRVNIGLLIRSKVLMESLPEELVEAGTLVKKKRITDDIILEGKVVRKDKTEINILDGDNIIRLLESYPLK